MNKGQKERELFSNSNGGYYLLVPTSQIQAPNSSHNYCVMFVCFFLLENTVKIIIIIKIVKL